MRRKRRNRVSSGGSFEIDRTVKGIGRVRMASGIFDQAVFDAFSKALTVMSRSPVGLKWIAAMHRRQVRPLEVWGAYSEGRWQVAPIVGGERGVVDALKAWREDMKDEVSSDTYRTRKELITRVTAVARPDSRVEELPDIMRMVRARMADAKRTFNQMRNYARAFARDTLGRRHPVYLGVVDVPPFRRVKKKRLNYPMTPIEVMRLAHELRHPPEAKGKPWTSAPRKGSRADEMLAMVLTGMNPKEYWRDRWTVHLERVHIEGQKTGEEGHRVRNVVKLFPSKLWPHATVHMPEAVFKPTFVRAFAAAAERANLPVTPYDCRRTFANWLELAQVPRARRKLYMGHAAADITDLYEWQDVKRYLVEDAAKVITWIEAQLAAAPRLEVARG
jgi:integrase